MITARSRTVSLSVLGMIEKRRVTGCGNCKDSAYGLWSMLWIRRVAPRNGSVCRHTRSSMYRDRAAAKTPSTRCAVFCARWCCTKVRSNRPLPGAKSPGNSRSRSSRYTPLRYKPKFSDYGTPRGRAMYFMGCVLGIYLYATSMRACVSMLLPSSPVQTKRNTPLSVTRAWKDR